MRMTGTVFLRHLSFYFLPEFGDALFDRCICVLFGKYSSARMLNFHASFVKLVHPAVFFDQFFFVLLHIIDDGIKLVRVRLGMARWMKSKS